MNNEKRMAIIDKAMEEAGKILGVDPAYYGEEGEEVVDDQIRKMGYNPDEFKKKKPIPMINEQDYMKELKRELIKKQTIQFQTDSNQEDLLNTLLDRMADLHVKMFYKNKYNLNSIEGLNEKIKDLEEYEAIRGVIRDNPYWDSNNAGEELTLRVRKQTSLN